MLVHCSTDERELGARELALEEPMAQIDSQVNLIMLLDVKDRLLVLHVNCHELVADLGSVLCVVH